MSEADDKAPEARWRARFDRERAARKEAERLLEEKSSEVYQSNEELSELTRHLESLVEERTKEAKRNEAAFAKLNQAFLRMGSDSLININLLTATCGEMLNANCALYNRLEGERLCAIGQWQTPPDYPDEDPAEGRLCFNLIAQGPHDKAWVVHDLDQSTYAVSDPKVAAYGVKTYIGHVVTCGVEVVGSLCVAFQSNVEPTELECNIMEILATAIGVEEDRRRAALASKDNETRFTTLFQRSMDGIILHDAQGRVLEANDQMAHMLGYPTEELYGMGLPELHPPAAQAQGKAAMQEVRDNGFSRFEADFLRADGSTFPAEVSATLFETGGKVLIQGITRDVSARKSAEQAIRRNEDALRGLYEVASNGEWNLEQKIDAFLSMGCRRFGLPVGILSRIEGDRYRVEKVFGGEGIQAGQVFSLGETYCAETIRQYEPVSFTDGGTSEWKDHPAYAAHALEAYIGVKVMRGGELYGTLNFSGGEPRSTPFDDSDQRVAQLMAQWIGAELDREAAYSNMKRARDDAERANHAKSLFLANMSHEIRTPMNGIIGVAELLATTIQTSEQCDLTKTIHKSGETLLALINDILDISKIESDQLELDEEDFSIHDMVERSLGSILATASAKNVEMACLIDPEVRDAVRGDGLRFQQILANLLGNAVKFTEAGEVYLHVAPEQREDGREFLRVAVRDTGIGIEASDLPVLFDKFTQVDASSTRRFGGTGLGLAICKRLCEAMGGTIHVESVFGSGSTFIARLPFAPARHAVRSPVNPEIDLSGKRVLIVDDNETNRQIMHAQCHYLGMQTCVFSSASDVIEHLAQASERFDLGLIDMQMPGMNGLELGRALRQADATRALPLILVSSLGKAPLAEQEQNWPFDQSLYKPILLKGLVEVITRALNPDGASEPVRTLRPEPPSRALHLLVAEDNPINLRVTLQMLAKMGHRADTATTGIEVLEKLEQQTHYDVILMDIQMPELDGVETTHRIHEMWPAEKRPLIIALTADALKGDREKYLAEGMDAYLSKPLRIHQLSEALQRLTAPTGAESTHRM